MSGMRGRISLIGMIGMRGRISGVHIFSAVLAQISSYGALIKDECIFVINCHACACICAYELNSILLPSSRQCSP